MRPGSTSPKGKRSCSARCASKAMSLAFTDHSGVSINFPWAWTDSDDLPRPERPGQDLVELVGDLHGEGEELVIELGGVVEIELMAPGGIPEDVAFGAHEVEMGDDEAIVLVDPDGHEGLAGGALGAHRGSRELDLLLGHALDGDLAGGAAADRGDDGQAIRADGDVAVGGRLGPGSGLDLLERREGLLPELVEVPLEEAERIGVGQPDDRPVAALGLAAISSRLTWLPLIEIDSASRSASSTRAKGSASSSSSRGLSTRRSSESSRWATSGAGTERCSARSSTTPASGTWSTRAQR